MLTILAFRCDISLPHKLTSSWIKIEKLENLDNESTYKQEILIWNNNFNFGFHQLALFPNLRFFINWGVDDRNIQTRKQFIDRNIVVKKVDYYCTETSSEYILAMILNFERKFNLLLSGQKIIGNEIYGKRVGIIGLGKIGFRIAQMLKASFNCRIYYYSRKNKLLDSFDYIGIKKIFQICDYVILTVKSKNFTIDEKKLISANKNLVIVNISNDSILPLKKVVPFIRLKKIRGYVGDLINTEVDKKDLPENVVLINHYGYLTVEAKSIKDNILIAYLKKIYNESASNNIYIIRHGQTEWNKLGVLQGSLDSPLTKDGMENAQKISLLLKDKKMEKIFTSPLKRTKETARIIALETGARVKVIPEFREMNFGIFEGKDPERIKELFKDFFIKREENKFRKLYESYPEGESYFDVFLRIVKVLTKILANYDNFVIVGHQGINRIIRGIIRELPLEEAISLRQKNNEVIGINLHTLKETIINLD